MLTSLHSILSLPMNDHCEMGLEEQKESLHLETAMKSPRSTAEQMMDPHNQEVDE